MESLAQVRTFLVIDNDYRRWFIVSQFDIYTRITAWGERQLGEFELTALIAPRSLPRRDKNRPLLIKKVKSDDDFPQLSPSYDK